MLTSQSGSAPGTMFSCCIPEGNVAFLSAPAWRARERHSGRFSVCSVAVSAFPQWDLRTLTVGISNEVTWQMLAPCKRQASRVDSSSPNVPGGKRTTSAGVRCHCSTNASSTCSATTGCGSICQCARVQPLKSCAASQLAIAAFS